MFLLTRYVHLAPDKLCPACAVDQFREDLEDALRKLDGSAALPSVLALTAGPQCSALSAGPEVGQAVDQAQLRLVLQPALAAVENLGKRLGDGSVAAQSPGHEVAALCLRALECWVKAGVYTVPEVNVVVG